MLELNFEETLDVENAASGAKRKEIRGGFFLHFTINLQQSSMQTNHLLSTVPSATQPACDVCYCKFAAQATTTGIIYKKVISM